MIQHFKKEIGVRAPCGVLYGTKAKFTRQRASVSCPKCREWLDEQEKPDV